MVITAALVAGVFAQSATRESQKTFHVQGTIDSVTNGALPRVEVTFQGDNATRTVSVNDKGFYETDLPIGAYTMTAELPPLEGQRFSLLTKYVRLFEVKSASTITLNGFLDGPYACDGVWGGNTDEEREDLYKDDCGGMDSFTAPCKEGVPLRIDVSYGRRERNARMYRYSAGFQHRPVFLTYNLFSVRADSFEYDVTKRTVRARGNVVIDDESGESHAESASFELINGTAVRIQW